MRQYDSWLHARGEGQFVDDLDRVEDMLFAYPVVSDIAHGLIENMDVEATLKMPGVVDFLTHEQIPGRNWIGNVAADETLLSGREVVYQGQPVALVIAESAHLARQAAQRTAIQYKPLPAVFDVREADRLGSHIAAAQTFSLGDVDAAWRHCDVVVTGTAESGAQEHVYLEPQVAVAYPLENNGLKVYSATQSPGMVQRIIARVLAIPMHLIEVDVPRLGGGFGGKEEQATPWAVMAALAADRLKKPVKLVLQRRDDMLWTGKRHPYAADFKIGLNKQGKILAYEVNFLQNAGAVADLSLAILDRSLFHAGNSYFIADFRATAVSCRTNLPPNTAFRGFGAPQAMFVLEAAIFQAAAQMGMDSETIQQLNLLQEGDHFPYGMPATRCLAQRCLEQLQTGFDIQQRQTAIRQFNAEHALQKRAMALMPVCFGISFTAKFLNQADALVHIYADGSVSVSCGAVEMGQRVKDKITVIVARVFSINVRRVKFETTNTSRIANMSPTAASTGADLNGHAADLACRQLLAQLQKVAAEVLNAADPQQISVQDEQVFMQGRPTGLDWRQLVSKAYFCRTQLSAQAHYATPGLCFDNRTKQGTPFAYHVYGCAAVAVTLDCLRGEYTIDAVQIVHDAGQSLDPAIDRGQIEGGVVQGLGWMTIEEIIHDLQGKLLTDTLTAYKIPDIYFAPDIEVRFLQDVENPPGLYHSKAIGEPPFMYGIGAFFALSKAIRAFNPQAQPDFTAPMTPERVLMALYSNSEQVNQP